jgi:hypothetical protein
MNKLFPFLRLQLLSVKAGLVGRGSGNVLLLPGNDLVFGLELPSAVFDGHAVEKQSRRWAMPEMLPAQ